MSSRLPIAEDESIRPGRIAAVVSILQRWRDFLATRSLISRYCFVRSPVLLAISWHYWNWKDVVQSVDPQERSLPLGQGYFQMRILLFQLILSREIWTTGMDGPIGFGLKRISSEQRQWNRREHTRGVCRASTLLLRCSLVFEECRVASFTWTNFSINWKESISSEHHSPSALTSVRSTSLPKPKP